MNSRAPGQPGDKSRQEVRSQEPTLPNGDSVRTRAWVMCMRTPKHANTTRQAAHTPSGWLGAYCLGTILLRIPSHCLWASGKAGWAGDGGVII